MVRGLMLLMVLLLSTACKAPLIEPRTFVCYEGEMVTTMHHNVRWVESQNNRFEITYMDFTRSWYTPAVGEMCTTTKSPKLGNVE